MMMDHSQALVNIPSDRDAAEIRPRTSPAAGLVIVATSDTRCRLDRTDRRPRWWRLRRVVRGYVEVVDAERRSTGDRRRWAMVTMTYRPGIDYQPYHVSRLVKAMREWHRRRRLPFRYCWVAELQQRGAVHYHMLVLVHPRHPLPKPDRAGWWPYGSTRIEWARKACAYITKYASKGVDDAALFPKGLRAYGVGSCPVSLSWHRSPSWMRRITSPGYVIRRERGGWWWVEDERLLIQSPYVIAVDGDGVKWLVDVGWDVPLDGFLCAGYGALVMARSA